VYRNYTTTECVTPSRYSNTTVLSFRNVNWAPYVAPQLPSTDMHLGLLSR